MSKIIHEAKPARYVVEIRDSRRLVTINGPIWAAHSSYRDSWEATSQADRLARMHPDEQYRVIDTEAPEQKRYECARCRTGWTADEPLPCPVCNDSTRVGIEADA